VEIDVSTSKIITGRRDKRRGIKEEPSVCGRTGRRGRRGLAKTKDLLAATPTDTNTSLRGERIRTFHIRAGSRKRVMGSFH
jgi:hypothetical protein